MDTITMKLSDLHHPEKNPRKHPAKQIKEMKRSIEKFGQFRPVVVDENNTILAGNGLVIAMRELGYETADVLKYTDLSENDKKKLMLADNQVASLGVDDYGAIEEILRSLEGDIDVPGYDEDTLAMLVEESAVIVQEVQNYGVYAADEVAAMKRVAAEREENGFSPVAQTYEQQPVSQPVYQPAASPAANYAEEMIETQPTQRFVICPNCGEKIYL